MFALTSNALRAAPAAARAPSRSARRVRRVSAVADGRGYVLYTAEMLARDAPPALEASEASEPAAPEPVATPEPVAYAASPAAAKVAAPASAFSAAIDPADGSVAEAAPLGDDLSMLNAAMVAFKTPRAVEIINGRVAMIGWMLALGAELFDDQSLARQVVNTRTFVLADGVERVTQSPAEGMFLVPLVVLLVIAASIAPQVRGEEGKGGLETEPEAFGPFKAESEMTNGRGAMVGLAALFVAEKLFTHGSALL